MIQHISDHTQGVFVDIFNIVIQRMPYIGEAVIAAVGIQIDDVNGGDAGKFVQGQMVVADGFAQFVGESITVSQILRRTPHFVAQPGSIALGVIFLHEVGVRSANHIQQDAEVGLITSDMGPCGPKLRA